MCEQGPAKVLLRGTAFRHLFGVLLRSAGPAPLAVHRSPLVSRHLDNRLHGVVGPTSVRRPPVLIRSMIVRTNVVYASPVGRTGWCPLPRGRVRPRFTHA